MESQQVIVYSADVAAFVDALETIGYPVVEAQANVVDGEVVEALEEEDEDEEQVETYAIESSEMVEQQLVEEEEPPRPTKRFRTNPKVQKETIEKLFEKQKAVVTEKGFMNMKGNKRFKSDVWSWFGDIKLLISRSEAKKLQIPFYFRQCGDEQMMLSKAFVGCFRCSALFLHNAQRSGTSTLRAHMRVCSRPRPRKKKGAPTIIFFPNKQNNRFRNRVANDDDKQMAQEQMLNFILSTESAFDVVEDAEFQKLLQMCIAIGSTYGDVNVESMLCPQEKLSDFLLNDLYITAVNSFYTDFQYAYGATFTVDIWMDEQQRGCFISTICHYASSSGEFKSVTLHTDEFSIDQKASEDVHCWFFSVFNEMPVVPAKRLILTDNISKTADAFREEECIKCSYQNLSTAVQSVFNKVMQTTQADYTDLVSLVCGCKDIVSYFEQRGFQNQLPEPLKMCKDDNWTSLVSMFHLIQRQFEEILHILNETGETHLLSVDKAVITAIIDLFQIFDTALAELSDEKEPTLNIVIPWITKLRKHCIPCQGDFPIIQQLKTQLVVEINEHLTKNITVYHRIATLLDPRFKRLVFLPRDEQMAANIKLKCMIKECAESPFMEDYPEGNRPPRDNSNKDRFSDLYSSNVSYEGSNSSEKSAHHEFDAYVAESFNLSNQDPEQQTKFNPLKFWIQNLDKYPNLFRVALWVLSCPASCVQSDFFWHNDWLLHYAQIRQKPEHVNKILFVKSFRKL